MCRHKARMCLFVRPRNSARFSAEKQNKMTILCSFSTFRNTLAIMYASEYGQLANMQLLVAFGADLNAAGVLAWA